MSKVQERGSLFVEPGADVYENQIIGVHAKTGDLKVNACRLKELTNIRAARAEEALKLNVPLPLTLEEAVEYVVDGEFVEVTPKHIRMGVYSYDPKKSRQKA